MNIVKIRNEMRNGRTIFDLPLRVTFYARVSTDRDEQLNSLENQVQYYTELIQSKRSWSYVPGYIDEGISGTSTKKRDSFLRMIRDAKDGRFDFIITKEISRFSRSTLDSIQYTQELLEHDVGVLFQNDNINTLDPDSEFRLVVMAGVTPTPATPITSQTADKKRPGWHGLLPGALCALTALRLQRLLERGEGFFLDARDVRARDAELGGDLALRFGGAVAQTVAQRDDGALTRREHITRRQVFHVRLERVHIPHNHLWSVGGYALDCFVEAERTARDDDVEHKRNEHDDNGNLRRHAARPCSCTRHHCQERSEVNPYIAHCQPPRDGGEGVDDVAPCC